MPLAHTLQFMTSLSNLHKKWKMRKIERNITPLYSFYKFTAGANPNPLQRVVNSLLKNRWVWLGRFTTLSNCAISCSTLTRLTTRTSWGAQTAYYLFLFLTTGCWAKLERKFTMNMCLTAGIFDAVEGASQVLFNFYFLLILTQLFLDMVMQNPAFRTCYVQPASL